MRAPAETVEDLSVGDRGAGIRHATGLRPESHEPNSNEVPYAYRKAISTRRPTSPP